MKHIFCLLFLGVVLVFGALSANAQDRCKVTDPTGTPLNVRSSPNGKIKGKVSNGTVVHVETESTDTNGKAWSQISVYRRNRYVVLGWVYREFISCY